MGQGGSRVTLMEAWPASLRILSTKLCCSCACKCQLPSLISPFPRRTPALPQLAPVRSDACTVCSTPGPSRVGAAGQRPRLSISRGSLRPWQELSSARLPWRSARLTPLTGPHLLVSIGFPGGSDGKKSAHNAGELGSIPGSGRTPGGREWLPTLVFLPGEFRGQRSLAAYTAHNVTESDTAE